jgi:F-box-like
VETDSIVYPPLVQASNGKISARSGAYKLPVELLSLIFDHCDSAIRPRLVLTHTCQQWRFIAVNYPQLWTDLRIITHNIVSEECYERFGSLLTLQVDRSGGLPLDITWDSDIGNKYGTDLLVSLQDMVPFLRWRSLEICVTGHNSYMESHLPSIIVFPNLESLVISSGADLRLAEIFCRAAMPKLQMLDLRIDRGLKWGHPVMTSLNDGALSIPDSIITLHAGTRYAHPFPNILNYNLNLCVFSRHSSINLHSMTSFIIDGGLYVYEGCEVLLPALKYLQLMSLRIFSYGKIEAPVLQTLHISATIDRSDLIYKANTNHRHLHYGFKKPGFGLLPTKLIIREPSFSKESIIEVFKNSPKLTQATVCFNDRASAQGIVEALLESGAERASLNERLCPQLTELMLDCEWDANMPLSAELLPSGLEVKKVDPQKTRVSIKARRKGEEWYQLLAEW